MGGCGCNRNQKASLLFKDCGCGCKGKKQEHKFIISVMSALIFFVVANPETFRAVRGIAGNWVSSPTGCPTIGGLAFHALVFMLVVWGLMNIRREGEEQAPVGEQMGAGVVPPKDRGEGEGEGEQPALPPERDVDEILAEMNSDDSLPPTATTTTNNNMEIDVHAKTDMTVQAPPVQGMNNTADLGTDEDYMENTLAPYSPINDGDPSMEKMASTATVGMSQKLGGPVPTIQPQDTLKMGNYMQCKCGDGSHVMLMK